MAINRPKRSFEKTPVHRGAKLRKSHAWAVQEFPKNMVVVGSGDASATWILIALLGRDDPAHSQVFKRLFAN